MTLQFNLKLRGCFGLMKVSLSSEAEMAATGASTTSTATPHQLPCMNNLPLPVIPDDPVPPKMKSDIDAPRIKEVMSFDDTLVESDHSQAVKEEVSVVRHTASQF